MKLFGKTKMQKAESVLAALRKRAALLTDKRVGAEAALDTAMSARQAHMLGGDLSDERLAAKLQGTVDSCSSSLSGIIDALNALQGQIETAEAQLTAEQERAERKAASERIVRNVAAVERQIGPWLAASREIAAALAKFDYVFEAGQIGGFIANTASEVEVAVAVTVPQLHSLSKAVADGSAPIPRTPDVVAPVPEPECKDLDADEPQEVAPAPVEPTPFVRIDRGPNWVIRHKEAIR